MNISLPIRHHQQDDITSCGRACAQMVIHFEFVRLAVPSGTVLPFQNVMAGAETGTMPGWATEPAELAKHINDGLAGRPGANTWTVVEFKPSVGSTNAPIEVASALFTTVKDKLCAGFPSVVMIDGNDHWETAYGITVFNDHTDLHTIDPLPIIIGGLGTQHKDGDLCNPLEDTIWFLTPNSAAALVCDAPDFVGSALGIVQTPSGSVVPPSAPDLSVLNAWEARRELDKFDFRDPLPPLDKNLPLIALINFFKRDLWRMVAALKRLPEAASFADFDWARVVVRHMSFHRDPDRRMAIVAAPPREGLHRSILLSISNRGEVEAMKLTSAQRMVESLRHAGAQPLWIVPKYGRWLPCVRVPGEGPVARFRRLYDDIEIEVPAEGHGKS